MIIITYFPLMSLVGEIKKKRGGGGANY